MRISAGSIQQLDKSKPRGKCRKWRLCVHVDNARRSRRFTGTISDAKAALEQWRSELAETPQTAVTFAQYAEQYCAFREQMGNLSAATCTQSRTALRAFMRTGLRDMRMSEIKQADIERALLSVRDCPQRRTRKGALSGTALNNYYAILRTMFKHAEQSEVITRNPCRYIQPPKLDTRERAALTPLEIELLLNRLDDEPLSGEIIALYLMLTLGLRKGEALGAYTTDFRDGIAHIQRAMKASTNQIGTTKTACGVRDLPMPARLLRKLREWTEHREQWGIGDALTMVCSPTGAPLKCQHMQSWWTTRRERLGCAGLTLHQLRHSNLSMMARVMPSAFDLQRWAGWSDISPARVYIHTDLDVLRAAASAVLVDNPRQKRAT